MSTASRDDNFVTTLLAVSSVDGVTPVTLYANPTTHRLLVDLAGGGSGTVQTVAVATANGFAGTSDGNASAPTLTLTTSVTGILKGNGTAISAATAADVISAYYFVAANDATTKEKALADYQCDGTADEVQINAALAAVKASGGKVVLSSGTFNCAATIAIAGNTANSVDNPATIFWGSGIDATYLNMASGINGITLTNEPKYDIGFLSINLAGAADGIRQTAGTERGNWQSHIHDIFIETDFTSHGASSWGINMESPFRMRFTNIEMNGVCNGINLQCHTNSFNPGNLSMDRVFIDLWDNATAVNAIGLKLAVLNTTATGVMNLVTVNRLDIAGGTNLTGSVGINIVGATASYGDSRHHTFTNLNIEDIKTVIKMERGRDCTFNDINYCRVLSGGTFIECDSSSHNNFFENAYVVAQGSSQTFNLIVDNNGSSNLPNSLKRVDGFQPSTVTINATLASNTILEQVDLSGGSPTIDSDITNRNNTRTFQNVLVDDEAYGAGWNGSLEVPTKNAVYDKIETIGGGSPGGSDTQVQYNNAGAFGGITGLTTNGTYVTLTAPRFADLGFIADANGNELLVMDTVTSAVNELAIANAATGGRPLLAAQGSDTNVDLALQAKGSGTIVLLSTIASTTDRNTFAGGVQVNGSFIAMAANSAINWNSGNATLTHSTGLLTSNVPLSLGTSNSLTAGTIELGAATDTTIVREAAGIISVENEIINGYTSTATAAGTTTLTRASAKIQAFTGTTTQTVTLPTTGIVAGQQYQIQNVCTTQAGVVTVQSSGANTVLIMNANCSAIFTAVQATPTTAAHWRFTKLTKNISTATSYTTDTGTSLNCDYYDGFHVTAQTGALLFNAPSGTPQDGQSLIITVASSTTAARALTYNAIFEASTVALPTTTAATTAQLNIGFRYSVARTKWVCIASC